MAMTRDQTLTEAMALDPREREALAAELLLSLGEDDRAAIDQAWLAEAKRREAEFARGAMPTSPVDDAIERVRARARR